MKKRSLFLTIATAVLVLGLAQIAMAAATMDSTSWESKYEGDVMPNAATPAWTATKNADNRSTIVGGSYMNYDNELGFTTNEKWDLWKMDDAALTATNFSFDFRMRVNDGYGVATTGAYAIYIDYAIGGSTGTYPSWYMYPAGYSADDTSKVRAGGGNYYKTLDTSQWHTYRLTHEYRSGTNDYELNMYLDDVNNPYTWTRAASDQGTLHHIQFGNGGSWTDYDLDFFRWTTQGAFPAPEPATLAVLGIGGLLALLQRRRRR